MPSNTFFRNTFGVVVGLQHVGRNGGHERGRTYVLAVVAAHVTRDFAPTHREADEGRILDIGGLHDSSEIIAHRVVVVACPGLLALAEAAAAIHRHAVTGFDQLADIVFPHGVGQWPTVDQHDIASFTIGKNVKFGAVFCFGHVHVGS